MMKRKDSQAKVIILKLSKDFITSQINKANHLETNEKISKLATLNNIEAIKIKDKNMFSLTKTNLTLVQAKRTNIYKSNRERKKQTIQISSQMRVRRIMKEGKADATTNNDTLSSIFYTIN